MPPTGVQDSCPLLSVTWPLGQSFGDTPSLPGQKDPGATEAVHAPLSVRVLPTGHWEQEVLLLCSSGSRLAVDTEDNAVTSAYFAALDARGAATGDCIPPCNAGRAASRSIVSNHFARNAIRALSASLLVAIPTGAARHAQRRGIGPGVWLILARFTLHARAIRATFRDVSIFPRSTRYTLRRTRPHKVLASRTGQAVGGRIGPLGRLVAARAAYGALALFLGALGVVVFACGTERAIHCAGLVCILAPRTLDAYVLRRGSNSGTELALATIRA